MPSWLPDPLESTAAALSLLAVWWTARREMLCWPVGIVSVLLYAWIFLLAHLYSDMLLQLLYAALLAYGWWNWRRAPAGREEGVPRVERASLAIVAGGLACGLAGWALLGWTMATYTGADLAWLDAGLTAFSLVAEFWAARLLRANWLLWIGLDVVYVGMYLAKGLPVTAGLYAVFIALAAWGWREWGRASPRP
jgi:nicotinamide mononucleotide transporter